MLWTLQRSNSSRSSLPGRASFNARLVEGRSHGLITSPDTSVPVRFPLAEPLPGAALSSLITSYGAVDLQERPFRCQVCDKAFGRPYVFQCCATRPGISFPFSSSLTIRFFPPLVRDLLKRHAACHSDGGSNTIRRRRQHNQAWRVSQACKPCAAAKLKCDEEKPCGRCLERGIPCEREERHHARQARANASQQPSGTAHHPYYLTWLLLLL